MKSQMPTRHHNPKTIARPRAWPWYNGEHSETGIMDTTRASLLIRIRDKQDSAAWEEFDAIYRPMLRRFAKARGLADAQADDVVQQCLTAVSENIEKFQYDPSKGRFKGWLRALANNHIRNLFRKREEKQADSAVFRSMGDSEDGPEELFDQIWRREHLRHCLELVRADVKEATYRAFMAYVINEEPVEKVCSEMKMTRSHVQLIKWQLTRKLAEKMKMIVGEED